MLKKCSTATSFSTKSYNSVGGSAAGIAAVPSRASVHQSSSSTTSSASSNVSATSLASATTTTTSSNTGTEKGFTEQLSGKAECVARTLRYFYKVY